MDTIERLVLTLPDTEIDGTGINKSAIHTVVDRLGANHPMAVDVDKDVNIVADQREAYVRSVNQVSTNEQMAVRIEEYNKVNVSKYQQKKQRQLEKHQRAKNRDAIKNLKAVNEGDIEKHSKVSKRLYISKDHSEVTVVCEKTGIVSMMLIPGVQGRVLETVSVFASLSNARGLVQEGFEYLSSLDTQIVAGLFLTLAEEYELVRYIPSATGAENNAILRTCGKDKLIQGCLLIERYIHSNNHTFLPKLSLIYEGELKETGCEGRFTEWMKLVNDAILEPDLSEYDENALLDKPMRSIKDLKKEHTKEQREIKRFESLKDKNFKQRAQFRKDIKEARQLVKSLSNSNETSKKLTGFLSSLFVEETYLSVDTSLLGQVIAKLEPMESASAKRLVEILSTDRSALRAEISIDDLDDPLFEPPVERSEDTCPVSESNEQNNNSDTYEDSDDEDNDPTEEDLEQCEMEIEAEKTAEEYFARSVREEKQKETIKEIAQEVRADEIVSPFSGLNMPPGLSLLQKIKWKKEHQK